MKERFGVIQTLERSGAGGSERRRGKEGERMQVHGEKANGLAGQIWDRNENKARWMAFGPRAAPGEAVFETNASIADQVLQRGRGPKVCFFCRTHS